MNTDNYDKATLKTAQLEALLSAAIEPDTLNLLTEDTRAAYLGACRDMASEIGELLLKLAPSKPATAAA
jgi:hypothetical protein